MRLDNWYVVFDPSDSYLPPERREQILCGKVYGKEGFEDGANVQVSPIKEIKDELVYTKSGSVYELGEPDPQYEEKYPNARYRLIKHFAPKE